MTDSREPPSDRSRQETRKGRGEKTGIPRSISPNVRKPEATRPASGVPRPVSHIPKETVGKGADAKEKALTQEQTHAEAAASDGKKQSRIPISRRDSSPSSGHVARSEVSQSSLAVTAKDSTGKPDNTTTTRLDPKSAPTGGKDVSAPSPSVSAVSVSQRPATGIQESDSESESRLNRTLSRPSSERSTGSTTYSDLHDFDEEEEDIISSESDSTPMKAAEKLSLLHSTQGEEDVSEHASSSVLSVKETSALHTLQDLPGDDDSTPTQTPRRTDSSHTLEQVSSLAVD